jgi:ABC transport system ATP-binding/permease protein
MSRALLLSCEGISKAYGVQPLFHDLSFALYEGDRVGLVGPNGSGKTTLLKILAGVETPDAGTRSQRRLSRLSYVPQDPVLPADCTVEAVLHDAMPPDRRDTVDAAGRVAAILGRAGFTDAHQMVAELSAGWRKRLAIARELVASPDVLLLDEPTNHLDVEGILWLEELLRTDVPSYVVVSHDRYVLEHIASRMLELNRLYPDGLFQAEGRYGDYLLRRDESLREQAAYQETLANKVRREVEWLRRGPKARTRKAQARVKAAGRLIEELDAVRARATTGIAGIEFTASGRQSKKLLVTRDLTKAVGGRLVCAGLNLALTPGMRVGVLGPSGSGKSTLLSLLAGWLLPDSGRIERAEGLRVVRFDQNREGLDPAVSLRRALAPEGDAVVYRDRSVHVVSWAKRFLFRPEQLETAVGRLSGGERARILIARLMLQPADLLILDEPTNDLDIPTLEVLEETLADFPGALVLVTRDRFLLERVSTVILALDGVGGATFYADYAQWEAARDASAGNAGERGESPSRPSAGAPAETLAREGLDVRRLTYLEKREWEQMEQAILDAEDAVAAARSAVDDPAVASDPVALHGRWAALQAAQAAVDRLYERWTQLEQKQR